MLVKYNEKFVEELIREYPKEYLGEALEILYQQPTLGGFRPDLIFRDLKGKAVIVEVQLNALDRTHLYKSLEYRDLYVANFKENDVRMIVFCNSIQKKYIPIIESHKLQCVVTTKKDFFALTAKLKPGIKFTSNKSKLLTGKITVRKILNALSAVSNSSNDLFPEGTLALWTATGGIHEPPLRTLDYSLEKVAPKGKYFIKLYSFGRDEIRESYPKITIPTELGSVPVYVPFEQFVHGPSLAGLDSGRIDGLRSLLQLLFQAQNGNSATEVLGSTGSEVAFSTVPLSDVYGWYEYTRGRKKLFRTLGAIYGKKVGYDDLRLQNDLKYLSEFTLFLGKSPHFVSVKPFTNFDLSIGPGPLGARFNLEGFLKSAQGGNLDNTKIEEIIKQIHKEWVTITLYGMSSEAATVLDYVLWHLAAGHLYPNDKTTLTGTCHICVRPAREASTIFRSALSISSRYFTHIPSQAPNEPIGS